MKKVLMTASTFAHIKCFHQPYIDALRERGFSVCVACGGEKAAVEADRLLQLPLEKKFLSPANLKTFRMLRRELRANQYELIITHTTLASFWTRLAASGLKKPPYIITVVHGYLFGGGAAEGIKGAVLKLAELIFAGRTDLLLTMNKYDFDWAMRHRAGKLVHNIPGMGVIDRCSEGGEKSFSDDISDNDVVLLYPAEFSERKNQSALIKAMKKIPDNVKLILPGEGQLFEKCKSLAGEYGTAHRISFPGYVTDMGALYDLADIAITSSHSEGLPFNVLEAMRHSLPVIASRVKGNEDLVTDGVTGLLFPLDDEDGLVNAVMRLVTDKQLQRSMGCAGYEKSAGYTIDSVLPIVMKEYLTFTGGQNEKNC